MFRADRRADVSVALKFRTRISVYLFMVILDLGVAGLLVSGLKEL